MTDSTGFGSGTYYGVDANLIQEFGRLAIVAGRLEAQLQAVAGALNVDKPALGVAQIVKEIRQEMETSGLPSWARTTSQAVVFWTESAVAAFDRRNTIFHAAMARRLQDNEWIQVSQHLKSRATREVKPADLAKVRKALEAAHANGVDLELQLLPHMRDGIYVRVYPTSQPEAVVIKASKVDGSYPARPTDEEVDRFVGTLSGSA